MTVEYDAKKFTGLKLDWVKCIAADPEVPPRAVEIAFVIVQHVNARARRARLSDETISDETGSCQRDVLRGRNQLRKAGWLRWKRTGDANIYEPLLDKMNAMLDVMIAKRDLRQERRAARHRSREN